MRVGIDIDTWKLTLCALSDEVVCFETAPIRTRGQTFFDAILGVQHGLSMALPRLGVVVDEVYIERGRGQHRAGEYELGAIYGATAVAVKRTLPDVHVQTVALHSWKKIVTAAVGVQTTKGVPGLGNAPKAICNAACRTLLRQRGLDPSSLSPDELDAFGIVYSVMAEVPVG